MSEPTTVTSYSSIIYPKVTTDEMLEELDYLEGASHLPHSERTDAIRALIESSDKGPKVDEAAVVKKYADILSPETTIGLHGEKAIDHLWWREQIIRDLLREAGVRVKEEK